jgi:hypothetical protein
MKAGTGTALDSAADLIEIDGLIPGDLVAKPKKDTISLPYLSPHATQLTQMINGE